MEAPAGAGEAVARHRPELAGADFSLVDETTGEPGVGTGSIPYEKYDMLGGARATQRRDSAQA
jgi:hypothetical protein